MKKKLTGWKATTLPSIGRATLVRHVLNFMLFYFMQTIKMPISFCEELDKVCRDFLRSHNPGVNKIHLIGWCCFLKNRNPTSV